MSEPEHEEYRRLKARARCVYHVSELTGPTVTAMASARVNDDLGHAVLEACVKALELGKAP